MIAAAGAIKEKACHPERSEAKSKDPVALFSACDRIPRRSTGSLDCARDDRLWETPDKRLTFVNNCPMISR